MGQKQLLYTTEVFTQTNSFLHTNYTSTFFALLSLLVQSPSRSFRVSFLQGLPLYNSAVQESAGNLSQMWQNSGTQSSPFSFLVSTSSHTGSHFRSIPHRYYASDDTQKNNRKQRSFLGRLFYDFQKRNDTNGQRATFEHSYCQTAEQLRKSVTKVSKTKQRKAHCCF